MTIVSIETTGYVLHF